MIGVSEQVWEPASGKVSNLTTVPQTKVIVVRNGLLGSPGLDVKMDVVED